MGHHCHSAGWVCELLKSLEGSVLRSWLSLQVSLPGADSEDGVSVAMFSLLSPFPVLLPLSDLSFAIFLCICDHCGLSPQPVSFILLLIKLLLMTPWWPGASSVFAVWGTGMMSCLQSNH